MITACFIFIVLGTLGALFLSVNALQKSGRLGAEGGRKMVHVGMGVIGLSLPWFFKTAGPVWLLGVLGGLAVAVVRFVPAATRRFGAVLGGVGRASNGDLYFPLGIALAFTLARGIPVFFCGAVGVLAFADTAGALVGTRWGRHPYSVFGNRKSLEGSAAVLFAAAGWVALSFAALGHDSWPASLQGGLLVGIAAMVIEAVSWRGLDNLLLPVAVVELMAIWTHRIS